MSSSAAYMETPAATMRLAFPKPPDPSLGTPNLFVLNDLLQYMCKCAQTHKSPISKRMNLLYVAIDNTLYAHYAGAEAYPDGDYHFPPKPDDVPSIKVDPKLKVAEIEARRIVFDLFDGVRRDFVDFHRRIEMHALVIERQLERGLLVRPLGLFGEEANFLIIGELHLAEFVRQIAARGFVLLPGQVFGLGCHVVEVERPELAGAEQAQQGRARSQCVAQPFGRQFWCSTGTNNHEQPSPKTDQKTNGQLSICQVGEHCSDSPGAK